MGLKECFIVKRVTGGVYFRLVAKKKLVDLKVMEVRSNF